MSDQTRKGRRYLEHEFRGMYTEDELLRHGDRPPLSIYTT